MFSIVIPLYNKELSIEKTIHSVLEQTFNDFEIIIVNDGSTDSSLKVVSSIKDDRIQVFDQINGGVSAARNRGIREAKYDWICFLDADDLWDRDKLKICYNEIKNYPNSKWLLTGFTTLRNHVEYNFVFGKKNRRLINIFEDLNNGLRIQTSAVIVRKELFNSFDKLNFTVGINNSEDREVWYKLSCICKQPIYIAKSLSTYIVNTNDSNSLTGNNSSLSQRNFLNMKSRVASFTKLIADSDKVKLYNYIDNFNRKAILNNWINGTADQTLLNEIEHNKTILSLFDSFPKIIKKIIVRLCF